MLQHSCAQCILHGCSERCFCAGSSVKSKFVMQLALQMGMPTGTAWLDASSLHGACACLFTGVHVLLCARCFS